MHYTENSQIEFHELPSQEIIRLFLAGKHTGPSLDDLHLDFGGGVKSDWNKKAFHLLHSGFCNNLAKMIGVPPRDNKYYHDLIIDQFEQLARIWKMAQPVTQMEDGGHVVEDLELVEAQVNVQREKLWKKNRHTTRCVNIGIFSLQDCHNADHSLQRYQCQLQVVEFMI